MQGRPILKAAILNKFAILEKCAIFNVWSPADLESAQNFTIETIKKPSIM